MVRRDTAVHCCAVLCGCIGVAAVGALRTFCRTPVSSASFSWASAARAASDLSSTVHLHTYAQGSVPCITWHVPRTRYRVPCTVYHVLCSTHHTPYTTHHLEAGVAQQKPESACSESGPLRALLTSSHPRAPSAGADPPQPARSRRSAAADSSATAATGATTKH
jgi:hypothetical protein